MLNIIAYTFPSCTKETSKAIPTPDAITLEKMVVSYNSGKVLEHEKAILTEGDMTIMTLPSKEVLFFLRKDGASTNDIFLGQGIQLSSSVQKELGRVTVAYLREAIAVQTEEGEIYTFTIGEGKGHETIQKIASSWSGIGYGLSFRWNRDTGPSDYKGLNSEKELMVRASSCVCVDVTSTNPPNCESGGAGSTACSIGATSTDPGCSVTCGSAYYSCCNPN